MPLSKHINTEKLISDSRDDARSLVERASGEEARKYTSRRYGQAPLPKYEFPSTGVDDNVAYQLIHDELNGDSTPFLNLASFVTTRMSSLGQKLVDENINKNIADQDQYKSSFELQNRVISMMSDLWKVPKDGSCSAVGTVTAGSSEGLLMGVLALKKLWQGKVIAENAALESAQANSQNVSNTTPATQKHKTPRSFKEPGGNMIFASSAHCCVEKAARYFDLEARIVPIGEKSSEKGEGSRYTLDPEAIPDLVDENTIGVVVIAGSTYTGHIEDVIGVNKVLDRVQKERGFDIPIHVDAASGGFVLPFAFPKHKWAFDVPRVHSINSSGHKYGGTYVGSGIVIWKDEKLLPKELVFEMHYLGSTELSFTLNFSRPAAPVIAQYYNFINLGYEGYCSILQNDFSNARILARALEKSGYFEVLSDNHRLDPNSDVKDNQLAEAYAPSLPVVAFRWTDKFREEHPYLEQKWVQILMKTKGWILPNYGMSENLTSVEIIRAVMREEMSEDMLDILVKDLIEVQEALTDDSSDFYKLALTSSGKKPSTKQPSEDTREEKKEDDAHQGYSRPC
ncbi:hypothetical protein E3P92_01264 [Wallemia ichthyophaga]|uniref:glutamate decarboxylase n=2 Tax=Wallemia ichthyophaga TaxID=245174 RepID=A0A4V4M5F3_WALIC|nr:Glutamate decarboxylase [Wallemia ichthyophaga EXF-994]TIA74463.1 hypothetical protein E3P91_00972 [Wallemia ichthyophaga]EOR00804.1 Glutamate decarboxylase [Wallemia ichthyophaga EXF-994]TIA82890.1 hypothetical protein E3P98_01071 [Wallemia ichthyophaga]TIA92845.1 hypothetical protein E3P97_01278 [Wallemia ichthyophaga]TIA96989.1 hypothetical protein E3P95_03045 [Wallemia ichthyophaga]